MEGREMPRRDAIFSFSLFPGEHYLLLCIKSDPTAPSTKFPRNAQDARATKSEHNALL